MVEQTQVVTNDKLDFLQSARAALGALDWRVAAALTATIVFWASAFPAIREGIAAYTPGHLALLRFLVASLALGVLALAMRMPLPALRDWPGIIGTAFLGVVVYHVSLNTGEISVAPGTASVIVAAAPAIMALLAVIFLKERLAAWGWMGIAVSFGGVAFIALGSGEGLSLDTRALFVVLAAVAQGGFFAGQKPIASRLGALRFTTCSIWAGTVMLLVFSPGLIENVQAAPLSATLSAVFLGIFPSAIGYATWAYVLSHMPAARASSFIYLIPALAILISWVWLGEAPTLIAIGGGVVVLLGVIMVNTWGKVRAKTG